MSSEFSILVQKIDNNKLHIATFNHKPIFINQYFTMLVKITMRRTKRYHLYSKIASFSPNKTKNLQYNKPRLICREQSLCRYRSTSSSTSSSVNGSPSTSSLSLKTTSFSPPSLNFAETPFHSRSSRPGPNGENRGGSLNPMGSTLGSDSE